jgi:hypothetical protein
MPSRTAIFHVENPLALVRDFENEDDRAAALAAIERTLSTVSEVDPLAYQAWRGRQKRRARAVVGAGEAARRVVAWRRSGGRVPSLPQAPALPAADPS